MIKQLPAFLTRTVLAITIMMMALSYRGSAQTYALSFTTTTGNVFPLGSTTNMVQWFYDPTHFSPTLPSSGLITTLYLRPASTSSGTFTNLTIKMMNTTITGMTGSAWHTGLTTVYSNSSASLSWTSGTWLSITLQTPFFYSGGNLILEISQTGYTSGMTIAQTSTFTGGSRQWGTVGSAAPTSSGAGQFVIGFDMVPANCSGTPTAGTITTAAMSAAAPICSGSTKALTATNPNTAANGLTFQWQSAPTSTGTFTNVTTGTGATTLNYTTGALTATTWFRLAITCTNSNITTYSAPYQVLVGASQPGTISGPITSCPGDIATYSVPNVSGHTYTWTLPSGWTGTSTTNTIQVVMGANPGTISVVANGCGAPSVARTLTILPGSAPSTPTAINGAKFVCPGTSQTYSVAAVPGAQYYVWTKPNGWTGTSTTNSITFVADTTSGNITVKAGNGCGQSLATTQAVTVLNALANPGTITTSSTNGVYCAGGLYTFSINPVPGATSYQWILPSGWIGTNTGTSIQAFAGSSGTVQVNAYVSCATSPSATISTPVSSSLTPTVSIATNNVNFCQGLPVNFTATPTNGGTAPFYQWKKNNVNVVGTGATYSDASLTTGDVVEVVMASSATCKTADSVRSNSIKATMTQTVTPGVSINSVPVITTCAGKTLNFTTTTNGGGTAPSYQWFTNGTAIAGATGTTYSSNSFANGDTLTVKVTTSAVCYTSQVGTSNKVGLVVNPLVTPSVTITSTTTLPGQPITFTATQSGGGTTPGFQWRKNGVDIAGETGDTYNVSSLAAGDHISVRLQSYDDCAAPSMVMSNEIVINSPASIVGTSSWDGAIRLYPNPNNGRFTVAAEWSLHQGKRVSIDLHNVLGQMIYHNDVVPNKTKWSYDIQLDETISAGHYTLRVTTQDGMKATLPVIIKK